MRIIYNPCYKGAYYIALPQNNLLIDEQVLETQGLLTQLALHAGIHQEIPSTAERLIAYHQALMKYNQDHPGNLFGRSIQIDSMSVAKSLLGWRDQLAMGGWNSETKIEGCSRLNILAEIDGYYEDKGITTLFQKLQDVIKQMTAGTVGIPTTFQHLKIVLTVKKELLPDYLQDFLSSLEGIGVTVSEEIPDKTSSPAEIRQITFTQQWQSEVWLSQQKAQEYDVWINGNNKRFDSWLHMSGQPLCGSDMQDSNPQITQMFLLAVQLFQRPLNVNVLLAYLYLPECPLPWKLARQLTRDIVNEGGFCNQKISTGIETCLSEETGTEDALKKYLPFDLRNETSSVALTQETDKIDENTFIPFMKNIRSYAASRAEALKGISETDVRIAQLQQVVCMTDLLLSLIQNQTDIPFSRLSQWAQTLYEADDYNLYQAQIGCRTVIDQPFNMISKAGKTIWCDCYGDESAPLSTGFLSNIELERLKEKGVRLWNDENEKAFQQEMLTMPIRQTTGQLTLVTCLQRGTEKFSQHPVMLHLANALTPVDGDALYQALCTTPVNHINNHKPEDDTVITFDAKAHPVTWREEESHTSLEKLLQTPLDYLMKYQLRFSEISATEIKLPITQGNVAHDVIETLFTADRGGKALSTYVAAHYEEAFQQALARKGALLLLPEHHLLRRTMLNQMKTCVQDLATIIEQNRLTVQECEKHEKQDLGFNGNVTINGDIDMYLTDNNGQDVIFDLKWTANKDKYKELLKENRASQLALYQALLQKDLRHPNARTAFFVMPQGTLYSMDFEGEHCEKIDAQDLDIILDQLRNGYAERKQEINEGKIETAYGQSIDSLDYSKAENVFPLETEKKKKAENKYSDYKCFTC